MKRVSSMKTAILLPLALLSAAVAAPASANWFGTDPVTGMRRHVGSAPNPTPEDIREYRGERADAPAKESSSDEGSNSKSAGKSG